MVVQGAGLTVVLGLTQAMQRAGLTWWDQGGGANSGMGLTQGTCRGGVC